MQSLPSVFESYVTIAKNLRSRNPRSGPFASILPFGRCRSSGAYGAPKLVQISPDLGIECEDACPLGASEGLPALNGIVAHDNFAVHVARWTL